MTDSDKSDMQLHINGGFIDKTTEAGMAPLKPQEKGSANMGLWNVRAMTILWLWYFFSCLTLFLNRYILESMSGDTTLLSTVQMTSVAFYGYIQMYVTCGMYKPIIREVKPPNFYRNMIVVGSCRFITVFLGLLALEYVTVSFTETVKSSAPIFTVLLALVLTGERTGMLTQISLIPIMGGLALCSTYELSFNFPGLIAALGTNLTECLQNVYSKMLVSGEKYKYGPGELQFYSGVASIVAQIPFCLLLMDHAHAFAALDSSLLFAYFINGFFFHAQTLVNYVLLDYISPVTHSVCNTVKRALLIWLSVLVFGNRVTLLSGLGTLTVTAGVFCYNKARALDQARLDSSPPPPSSMYAKPHQDV